MTPTGIRTGRQLDSQTRAVSLPDSTPVLLAPGDANRVALSVAAGGVLVADWDGLITIGPLAAGAVVPLTTLTPGHPVCYLSVDKIGSTLMQPIYASNEATAGVTAGVTIVRQVQELP